MSSSEDDSDVPEQLSLSASKRQAIGRKTNVAKELAQAKSKRKERNRERDRQLKQRTSKQRTEVLLDEEESSAGEDEGQQPKDPRLLPDHLFSAAFNKPFPAPGPSVPRDAPINTQQRERKRIHLTPKDRIVGQAFSSPLEMDSTDSWKQFPGCPDTLQNIRPSGGQTHPALLFCRQVLLTGAKRSRGRIPQSDSRMAEKGWYVFFPRPTIR